MSLRPLAILLLALFFASCASAPPAAPPPAKPVAAEGEKIRMIDLLCSEGARYVSFDKLGVPTQEIAVDVALTRASIWVLFPQRLLQIGRGGDHVAVRIQMSPPSEEWSKLDVDPVDESVWVASQSRPALFKVTSDGQMSTVKLQKVEGQGGFSGLLVARDAIYAQPTCTDTAVWRIDRSGKVLATAFHAPKPAADEPRVLQPGKPGKECFFMHLDRDADGHILAWNPKDRTAWQVGAEGAWTPSASPLFEHLPAESSSISFKGVDIGENSEHWFFTNGVGKLFFWKGKPVFLGSYANREKSVGTDTVLYLPSAAGAQGEVLMTCHKGYVREVATDATGYAAITGRFLVLGDLANAPDLP